MNYSGCAFVVAFWGLLVYGLYTGDIKSRAGSAYVSLFMALAAVCLFLKVGLSGFNIASGFLFCALVIHVVGGNYRVR